MENIPRISEAEWVVMKVLWRKSPLPASEVIAQLDSKEWKPETIKTLLNRLLKKNVISYTPQGRMYYYYPLFSEEECIRAESQSFLQRIYGGALKPMLVHFLEEKKLTPEEIEELKQFLEQKGE